METGHLSQLETRRDNDKLNRNTIIVDDYIKYISWGAKRGGNALFNTRRILLG